MRAMRRVAAVLMLVLVAEFTVSAPLPCCCFGRCVAGDAGARSREAPAHLCCHREDFASPNRDGSLPQRPAAPGRRGDCTCRVSEPCALGESGLALSAICPVVALGAPNAAVESTHEAETGGLIVVHGAAPPGASDTGPPSSSTPALLPALTT